MLKDKRNEEKRFYELEEEMLSLIHILPSYTFVSTADAFVLRGAKPVSYTHLIGDQWDELLFGI